MLVRYALVVGTAMLAARGGDTAEHRTPTNSSAKFEIRIVGGQDVPESVGLHV